LTIDIARMACGEKLDFTFRYMPDDRWIGVDYHLEVKTRA